MAPLPMNPNVLFSLQVFFLWKAVLGLRKKKNIINPQAENFGYLVKQTLGHCQLYLLGIKLASQYLFLRKFYLKKSVYFLKQKL